MKKIICFLCLCMFFTLTIKAEQVSNNVNNKDNVEEKQKNNENDITPKSVSSILIEASTGKVLFEKNADKALAPASMTKVMTMLLLMESVDNGKLKLSDKVLISKNASGMGGSQIFIEEKSEVTVKELLKGIGIASANDAAVAIAEKIGGTEANFVSMMNQRAKELGLKNTTFKNPHGLDADGHVSSARDLAIISKELVKYPEVLKVTGTYEEYMTKKDGSKFWLVNTNKLIRFYEGMDGLKTGYTPKAGYGLVATANKNNMRLISVVMKTGSTEERSSETVNLMEYGYSMFSADTLISKKKKLGEIYISNSKKRTYPFYLKDDVKLVTDKNIKKLDYKYKVKLKDVKTPIKKNQVIGKLILNTNNEKKSYDLTVKENIEKPGYFTLLFNSFRDLVSGSFSFL